MASYTYATLKTALQDITEDQGTEFASFVDTVIPLAEDRVLRDLDLEIFDVTTTGDFSSGNPVLNKPTGALSIRSLWYTDASSNFVSMENKSFEYVKDYWPNAASTTSSPKYYADYDNAGTQAFYLAGTPASTLAYTVRYVKRPTGLSSGNTSTWLSSNAGDLLLYACLIGCEQYLKADDRIQVWKNDYVERLKAARYEMRRESRDDYLPIKKEG